MKSNLNKKDCKTTSKLVERFPKIQKYKLLFILFSIKN